MKLKPLVSQKLQPHIAFALSIRVTRKGFDLNLQGMRHIAATLIWERRERNPSSILKVRKTV